MNNILSSLLLVVIFCSANVPHISAQTNRLKGRIDRLDQEVVVKILEGEQKGSLYPVILFDEKQIKQQGLSVGDTVLVSFSAQPSVTGVIIEDQYRVWPLFMLLGLFVSVVIIIGRMKGVMSFIAMVISFLIIGQMIVPQILLGNNPIVISLFAAFLIIPITFYTSHGFQRKTTIAVAATFIALFITGVLAMSFVHLAKLTGFASEEATFLQFANSSINIQNLLLAGIIIGAMGVLDDITISQTSIVEKLKKANPTYSDWKLFQESMDVGRDHIASLVNTLVLVYAGAALPLFVLFQSAQLGTFTEVLNMEIVATEVVRTLVSSIGIISAVPITTFLAVRWGK